MTVVNRIINWVDTEPMTSLLMVIAAIVLFVRAFNKPDEVSNNLWPWFRRLIESAVVALAFLGLLWAFRTVLTYNRTVFHYTHGSFSDLNLQSAYSIWGRPHVQRELNVQHFVNDELIEQNSIQGFTGEVDLTLSEREKGYALYNGFEADTRLEYEIVNDSDEETEVWFEFPLPPGQTVLDNFEILVDGKNIGQQLQIENEIVYWSDEMAPGQQKTVDISYSARGMEYFYYQISRQREINDFSLTMTIDRLPTWKLNYPIGCLTPIDVRPTDDGKGSILVWMFDHAITTSGMGVAIPQPEQPGAAVLRVLFASPYALTLLISMVSLTFLIMGKPIRFLELALLAAVYCIQFLIMAALSDYAFGFWGSLALGAASTCLLVYFLFRKRDSKLLLILVLSLVIFFTAVYPLADNISAIILRDTFEGLVNVALIIYLFVLSLYSQRKPEPAGAAEVLDT